LRNRRRFANFDPFSGDDTDEPWHFGRARFGGGKTESREPAFDEELATLFPIKSSRVRYVIKRPSDWKPTCQRRDCHGPTQAPRDWIAAPRAPIHASTFPRILWM